MPDGALTPGGGAAEDPVAAVRRFSRFYTRRVGALRPGLLGSGLPLAEARLLYEVAAAARDGGPSRTAAELGRALDLDEGHLSRVLRRLEARGLLARLRDPTDRRRVVLAPTPDGQEAFAGLDAASRAEVEGWLAPLSDAARRRLVAALGEAERLLGGSDGAGAEAPGVPPPARLRRHRPGDIGWIAARHGALYAAEYGWDSSFEALVAEIGARFLRENDPAREACWIAEAGDGSGAPLGSVMLVRAKEDAADEATAQLRLLLVDPAARGQGLGRRLVEECESFARGVGYRRIMLWTNSCLAAARRIYDAAGYRMVRAEPHRSFGHDLVGEIWEKPL